MRVQNGQCTDKGNTRMEKEKKQNECEERSLEEKLFLLKITERENCAVLGYCAASSGASLPTFRDILSVPTSRVKKLFLTFEDGTEKFVQKCR